MNRLSNPPPRSAIWQVLLVMLITSWSPSSNAITIDTISVDDYLLLDNTLLLNAGVAPTGLFSVRSDFGRGQIRALGLRSDFGREMIRMGREFNNYVRGRATARGSYSRLFLRDAGTIDLRSGARTNLRALSLRKSRQLLRGRYILARSRSTDDLLYANYAITDKNLIWTVTDKSNQVFALSNYKSVPEPGALLLFMCGLIGLAVVMFYRPRAQQQSVS